MRFVPRLPKKDGPYNPSIGDRVRVIGQDITGTVVRYDLSRVVVLDDDRNTWRFDSDPDGEEGVLYYRSYELKGM
jgi:hypothetical protein